MQIVNVKTFEEAQAVRNPKIGRGEGALVLCADHPGEPAVLIEKLIVGDRFVGQPLEQIKWKPKPVVIVVGKGGEALLAQIEKLAPGFKAYMPKG